MQEYIEIYIRATISYRAVTLRHGGSRGGGGALRTQRGGGGGGGGAAPALRISRKKGSFLRPPLVRDFVKEGYFFVPRYEVWGLKIPYNPRNIRGSDAE